MIRCEQECQGKPKENLLIKQKEQVGEDDMFYLIKVWVVQDVDRDETIAKIIDRNTIAKIYVTIIGKFKSTRGCQERHYEDQSDK